MSVIVAALVAGPTARKTKPWRKDIKNVHPINIHEKFLIAHNGVINTFPSKKLNDPVLEDIQTSTDLDTRKYLCHIIDNLNTSFNLKNALESVFREITIGSSANAFLFNSQQCHVITYHRNDYKGRHHTLFIEKKKNRFNVCTTPILEKSKEIDNNSLISINLNNLELRFSKLAVQVPNE